MSKVEIIGELPKLKPEERQEIFERICELQERDLLSGVGPTAEEKALLDHELEVYPQNPDAGSSWKEVEARIRQKPAQ